VNTSLLNNFVPNGSLPLQTVRDSEWTEEYYKKCLQSILVAHGTYLGWNTPYNVLAKMWRNYQIYKMNQTGESSVYMREALPDVPNNAVYIAGGLSHSIVNYHLGTIIKILKSAKVSAHSLSSEVHNAKSVMRDLAMFQYQYAEINKMLQEMGVSMGGQIPPHILQGSKRDLLKFVDSNFADENANAASILARGLMYRNDYVTRFKDAALHMLVGGMSCAKINNDNPELFPEIEIINPLNCLKDRRIDDDFGYFDEFAGRITWMPRSQVIAKYNLNDEEAKTLSAIAGNTNVYAQYETMYGFPLFYRNGQQDMVCVVEADWHSFKDSKYRSKKDKYDNTHVWKLDEKSGKIGTYIRTVRTGVLIGGTILKNAGEVTNLTINNLNLKPNLRYITAQPNTIFGTNTSMMDIMANLQEEHDNILAKVRFLISRDYGRIVKFDSSKYAEGQNMWSVLQWMRTEGILEYNSELGSGQEKGSLIDVMELGLPSDTTFYLSYLQNIENQMRNYTSTSVLSQGTQTTVTGKGVQENTQAANTIGNLHWMNTFTGFANKVVQQATDQARMNLASYEGEDILMELNYGQSEMIKATKDLSFSAIGTYLDIETTPDEQLKSVLLQQAQIWSQNNMIPPDTIVRMLRKQTYIEMEDELQSGFALMQQLKQAEAQQVAAQRQAEVDSKNKTQENTANTYSNATLQSEAMKQDGAVARDIINNQHERRME
jgi:hypothetical protein